MSRKKKTIEVPDKLVEGWEKAEQARVESTKAQPKKSARKKAAPEPEPRTAQPEP